MNARYVSPGDRQRIRRRWMFLAGVWLVLFGVLGILDRPVYFALLNETAKEEEWYQMFRQMGYIPTWIIVALAVGLADWSRASRGGLILLGALLSGLAAEILKPIIGRERPVGNDGWYDFHPLFGVFNGPPEHMGLPSSHAAVAFGGALVIARLFPATFPIMVFVGVGCALTRMLSGAHFLTDVVLGGLLAWLVAKLLVPRKAKMLVPFDGRLG